MKQFIKFIVLFLFISNNAQGQCENAMPLYDSLVSLVANSKKWTAIQMDGLVTLKYKGKFSTNTILNPRKITKKELNNIDSSSIFISFSFHDEWNDSLYTSVHDSNVVYFEKLTREYIEYYDNVSWPKKLTKEIFLENPMKYLKQTENKDVCTFVKIKALPDFRIGNCGIRYGCGIDFTTHYIVQKDERIEIESMLKKIRELNPNIKIGLNKRTVY